MFNFYDDNKNPFMVMMNMSGGEKESPMQFMQQAFSMQMQMMQTVMETQMQMMQTMAGFMEMAGGNGSAMSGETEEAGASEKATASGEAAGSDEAEQSGFKLGKMNIPPELLSKLLQMDMTPENLEKLQGILDFVFAKMPDSKEK